MFVCTGNICRSPLAHAVLEEKLKQRGLSNEFLVDSSGTDAYHAGEQADARMRQTARRHGVTVDHAAQLVTPDHVATADLLVAMDDGHVRKLRRMTRGDQEKIVKMREFDPEVNAEHAPDVPDPWYGGMDGFERVYEMVDRSCEVLADRLGKDLV
jgi:protein-tyrosine phosphatase